MIIIYCDICERSEVFINQTAMDASTWTVAEDEPDVTERHGLCAECGDQS